MIFRKIASPSKPVIRFDANCFRAAAGNLSSMPYSAPFEESIATVTESDHGRPDGISDGYTPGPAMRAPHAAEDKCNGYGIERGDDGRDHEFLLLVRSQVQRFREDDHIGDGPEEQHCQW